MKNKDDRQSEDIHIGNLSKEKEKYLPTTIVWKEKNNLFFISFKMERQF